MIIDPGECADSEEINEEFLGDNSFGLQIRTIDIQIGSKETRIEELRQKLAQEELELNKLRSERSGLIREGKLKEKQASHLNLAIGGERRKLLNTHIANYEQETFEWSRALRDKLRSVFRIENFRLCQLGICNANMDSRDIVCVMPTGGGKSLTYQLPAILTPGCTIVISPLLSLIADQLLHLKELRIEAVMLTSATPMAQQNDIHNRLFSMAKGTLGDDPEIKLCYVTPERIVHNKKFMGVMGNLAEAKKLARFVIDEAHCVSHLGHDFRPDYQKLSLLRNLFPQVPIVALSATCPPSVLSDLLRVLKLLAVTDGKNATRKGTVYFSSPLYRANLHYSVHQKPVSFADGMKKMATYILDKHPGESGIIYCLTRKDTENVAQGLREASGGKIKTGVYHAESEDRANLHLEWHMGRINVVCATIAFGLGIDKGDVRFVIHHSISKSLDGYYQESGRAGRDGKSADCILYYRAQDVSKLCSIVGAESDGVTKVFQMVKFAQNLVECRKKLFANHFSTASHVDISAWSTADVGASEPCGHCDNCTKDLAKLERKDVTLEAWQILKTLEESFQLRITVTQLAELARGFGSKQKAGKKEKDDFLVPKVGLSREVLQQSMQKLITQCTSQNTENLIVDLWAQRYISEEFRALQYTTVVYLVPSPTTQKLTSRLKEEIQAGFGRRIKAVFPGKKPSKKKKEVRRGKEHRLCKNGMEVDEPLAPTTSLGKRSHQEKKARHTNSDDEGRDSFVSSESSSDGDDEYEGSEETEEDGDGWTHSFLPVARKRLRSGEAQHPQRNQNPKVLYENDRELIVLSSD